MRVELQLNSVIVQHGNIEESYPCLSSALKPYLPIPKPKRRLTKRRKKTASTLIDGIIEDLQK